jgi:biotin operon repressor
MRQDDPKYMQQLCAALRLTRAQGKMLALILAEGIISVEYVKEHLGMEVAMQRTLIHRMRPRLKRHGIDIITQRGLGYTMIPEDREHVQKLAADFAPAAQLT